ncbi:MAG: hypothetical protein FWH27_02830 [Planctomycetaceae bacterium]|nr:hypothetical protein [Planctomycetaceae bacterium]
MLCFDRSVTVAALIGNILHSAFCTLHSALCTLHSALCILHSAFCTTLHRGKAAYVQ